MKSLNLILLKIYSLFCNFKNRKWIILYFLPFALLLNFSFLNDNTWFRIYDSANHSDNFAFSICKADASNYYILGTTYPAFVTQKGSMSAYVFKIDNSGDTIWSRIFGNHESIYTSISTSDGGCVFAGDRSFCVKINSDGNIVWDKTYTGIGAIYDIKRTSDLGYIACGGAFNFYGFILKLDSLGNKQWSRIFQEGFESTLASIEVLENDQFATTGIYRSTFTSGQTLFVLFDSVGNVVVNKKLNAKNRLSSGQKIIKSDENIIISGNTLDSLNTKNVSYFQRLDKAGNILFTKIFESDKEEIFENLNILNNNKYLFNTYRIVVLNDSNIAKAFMTDSLGRISVQKTFPVENVYTRLVTSIQAENSYLIFAGMIGNDSTFANDNTLVIKTDSNLNVKTTQVTNNNFIVNGFELFQNYPNPFNPSTNIQYEIPYNGFVKIKIYDITGREILILINEFKQVGKYEINFDGKNLSSGVYFYKFESGNFTATKKMILIK